MNEETKTLLQERDRLIEERNKAAARRDQLRHAVTRCDNRIRDLTSSERKRRTHHLCNMGGAICAISPQADALSQMRFYALMEEVFALPQVQRLVERAAAEDAAPDSEG